MLAETSSAIKSPETSYSCACGWSGASIFAFHAHRGSAHNVCHPASFYAEDTLCRCCLVRFGSRGLLMTHLTRGSGTCLLNIVMHFPPLTDVQHRDIRDEERAVAAKRIKVGLSKNQTGIPPVRAYGPLRKIVGIDGLEIDASVDNRHPFGPKKKKFLRPCFPLCECQDCIPA